MSSVSKLDRRRAIIRMIMSAVLSLVIGLLGVQHMTHAGEKAEVTYPYGSDDSSRSFDKADQPGMETSVHSNGLHLNGLHLNGLRLNDLTLNGVMLYKGMLSGNGSGDPLDGELFAYTLRETGLEQTPEGRKLLAYLIGCALPTGVTVSITFADQSYNYPGSVGLAPGWLQGALTETEERWLSACLYARTNYFGLPIQISMRAAGLDNAALTATEQEREAYTIFEGGFFGNLFAPGSPAYVCLGNPAHAERAHKILTQRVCTQASGRKRADGQNLSRCGFVLTGPCGDLTSLHVDGESYSEVIEVYLKPEENKAMSIRG